MSIHPRPYSTTTIPKQTTSTQNTRQQQPHHHHKMPTPKKPTYFLPPGWSLPVPSLPLGSIITHPTAPHPPIFVPSSPPPSTTTTSPRDFTGKPPLHPAGGITGLFGTFLSRHGLGEGDEEESLQYDRHAVLSYSARGVTTARFRPTEEVKGEALAPGGRVAAYLGAGGGRVFMVVGVKSVKGAGVVMGSGRGGGWRVTLGVGVEEGAGEGEGVVYAFEVEELGGGDGVLGDGEGLEERLGGVFGEGVFEVLEGVDESEGEGGCRIVVARRGCVDLLTAGSARIGGK